MVGPPVLVFANKSVSARFSCLICIEHLAMRDLLNELILMKRTENNTKNKEKQG